MKYKNIVKRFGAKIATGTALVIGSASAMAELPASIAVGLETVKADSFEMADLMWPVVIAVFGSFLLFKLFKRFGNKI